MIVFLSYIRERAVTPIMALWLLAEFLNTSINSVQIQLLFLLEFLLASDNSRLNCWKIAVFANIMAQKVFWNT